MKACVVAHYDPDDLWDENFLRMLSAVARVCVRTVVVTTSVAIADLPETHAHVELVRRPNVGYDFYSYRVGLSRVLEDTKLSGVFLLNSSLLLLNASRFETLLRSMADRRRESAIRGVTESTQIDWHLQSYLLYFDFQHLPQGWLQGFFTKVQPVNTKFEVVLAYEIGLGRKILRDAISVDVLFAPAAGLRWRGTLAWLRNSARSRGAWGWFSLRTWRALPDANWVHFGAAALALQYGFVKAEVLRSNPHELNLEEVMLACDRRLLSGVQQAVSRSQQHYVATGSGLTELASSVKPEHFSYQRIESSLSRRPGVKVAVVVHLYYIDLFDEILGYLKNIVEPFDLFVTSPFAGDVAHILNLMEERRQPVTILLGENRGRDVGPFIALCRSGVLNNYDAVLKLHSKKSRYSDQGGFWRKQLYEPLCGNSMTVLRSLSLLRRGDVGIVGPGRFFLSNQNYWGANRENLTAILESAGASVSGTDPELGFFAGTMFWFSAKALMAIQKMQGNVFEFEAEAGKQDGTLAHAWERAFCLLSRASGYRVTSLNISGNDIFLNDNRNNRVPVLEPF